MQDCECDEGCYYCMVTLRLKVSNPNPEQGKFMSVTSDMLEIVPSANGVSIFSRDPSGPGIIDSCCVCYYVPTTHLGALV